jgi:hypothetical protein
VIQRYLPPPTGAFAIAGQHCESFNPVTTTIYSQTQLGTTQLVWGLRDGTHLLSYSTPQSPEPGIFEHDYVSKALNVIKKYGFNQVCSLGQETSSLIINFLSNPNTSSDGVPVAK